MGSGKGEIRKTGIRKSGKCLLFFSHFFCHPFACSCIVFHVRPLSPMSPILPPSKSSFGKLMSWVALALPLKNLPKAFWSGPLLSPPHTQGTRLGEWHNCSLVHNDVQSFEGYLNITGDWNTSLFRAVTWDNTVGQEIVQGSTSQLRMTIRAEFWTTQAGDGMGLNAYTTFQLPNEETEYTVTRTCTIILNSGGRAALGPSARVYTAGAVGAMAGSQTLRIFGKLRTVPRKSRFMSWKGASLPIIPSASEALCEGGMARE